jgi:prepilin signal peptidase PulO-like enzyme (type II secretory pathway)
VLARPGLLASAISLALVLAGLALQRLGPTLRWWSLLPLFAILAAVVIVDLKTKRIPDVLVLPGILYALLLAAGIAGAPTLMHAILGLLVGGGTVLLLAVVSRGGVGGGDIKLLALLGAGLGWKGALIAFALSQLAGGVIALGLLIAGIGHRKMALPIGAAIALFGGILLACGG